MGLIYHTGANDGKVGRMREFVSRYLLESISFVGGVAIAVAGKVEDETRAVWGGLGIVALAVLAAVVNNESMKNVARREELMKREKEIEKELKDL